MDRESIEASIRFLERKKQQGRLGPHQKEQLEKRYKQLKSLGGKVYAVETYKPKKQTRTNGTTKITTTRKKQPRSFLQNIKRGFWRDDQALQEDAELEEIEDQLKQKTRRAALQGKYAKKMKQAHKGENVSPLGSISKGLGNMFKGMATSAAKNTAGTGGGSGGFPGEDQLMPTRRKKKGAQKYTIVGGKAYKIGTTKAKKKKKKKKSSRDDDGSSYNPFGYEKDGGLDQYF